MKVIKITSADNRHVQNLFNKVMPLASDYGAGAKYLLQEGDVTVKVCYKDYLEYMRKALNSLGIKFTEGEE